MRRRDFLTLVGGAAAVWPHAAHGQQRSMPVIGFLNVTSPEANVGRMRAFREGLKDTGYVESENVAIEYRWADNPIDRLPALAADLVRRNVAVIVATTASEALSCQKFARHDQASVLPRISQAGIAMRVDRINDSLCNADG